MALLAVVSFPLTLVAEAPADIIALWAGLILTPARSPCSSCPARPGSTAHRLSFPFRLPLFIVLSGTAMDLPLPAVCVALLCVPLEAAATGSRRSLVIACACVLAGSFVAANAETVHVSWPVFGVVVVAAIVLLAHMAASPVCRREARWSDGASPSLPLLGAA